MELSGLPNVAALLWRSWPPRSALVNHNVGASYLHRDGKMSSMDKFLSNSILIAAVLILLLGFAIGTWMF